MDLADDVVSFHRSRDVMLEDWSYQLVRTQIQLTKRQAAALKGIAAREHVSMAEVIRRSVDRTIDEQPTGEDVWRRVFGAAGTVRTGLNDLSENHDRYIVEALTE